MAGVLLYFLLPHRRLEGLRPYPTHHPPPTLALGRLSSDVTSRLGSSKIVFPTAGLLREIEFLWDFPGGPVVLDSCVVGTG